MDDNEQIYFLNQKLEEAMSVLKLISNDLSNKDGRLSDKQLKRAVQCVSGCLNNIQDILKPTSL